MQGQSPQNTIVVRKGKVIKAECWVIQNNQPFLVVDIEELKTGRYLLTTADPERGISLPKRGSLDEVLAATELHPALKAKYRKLFSISAPSLDAIRQAGFTREAVEFCQ